MSIRARSLSMSYLLAEKSCCRSGWEIWLRRRPKLGSKTTASQYEKGCHSTRVAALFMFDGRRRRSSCTLLAWEAKTHQSAKRRRLLNQNPNQLQDAHAKAAPSS